MRRVAVPVLASTVLTALLLAAACSTAPEPPEEKPPNEEPPEPTFKEGTYGGPPLSGTESLANLRPSPSGDRIALIRERTPGESTDPRNQLWIVGRDGSDPRLISVNTVSVHWHPNGDRVVVSVGRGDSFIIRSI